jgi:wyosine [tRNA(Phe)-imidazoG37] synthetase (radical SAM superfamily)
MSKAKVVHRFIRSANIESSKWNRIANRFDPFNNTLTTLSDPANQRTLTLIGTTNSSTTLAQRTKQLLEKIQPDAVYVQASPQWWNYAKNVNVQSIYIKV